MSNFENPPSKYVSIDQYILNSEILRNHLTGVAYEIQLADSINVLAENNRVETLLLNGKRFDCGDIQGYVEAIKNVFLDYIRN